MEKLVLTYEFDAPRELVFNAFGSAEALGEWWGPAESSNSVVSLDFKPGGVFHFKMDFGSAVSYGRFLFKTIKPHELLEFSNAFADEKANPIPAPFDVKLPVEIFYSLRFEDVKGKTKVTLTGTPVNASADETEGFTSIKDSMHDGFGATFAKLRIYLAS